MRGAVEDVARFLLSTQEADGYMGTYAPAARFSSDAAYNRSRTWDLWMHGYIIGGLLEVHRHWPNPRYLGAARKIGDSCLRTLRDGKSVAYLGNHFGLSASVLLEPAGERPELRLLEQAARQADLAGIGDGKA